MASPIVFKGQPTSWPVILLALMMAMAPALGYPGEELLQDTLKSILVSFFTLAAAFAFFAARREPDNTEAHYLSQKNHRVQQETRAESTNLIREVQGKDRATTEASENKDSTIGAKETTIAELENRTGPDKSMPRSMKRQGEEGKIVRPKSWSVG